MVNRTIAFFSLMALIVIMVMLNLTAPAEIGPLGVLVFFTMIYVAIFGIVNLIVAMFMKATGKKGTERKNRYYAATIAFGPIMLLLVQSFGSLSIATALMVVLFVALGCFVISKRL